VREKDESEKSKKMMRNGRKAEMKDSSFDILLHFDF
jgi:hypothetical protein